jgi:hypothetical protein
MCKVVAPIVYIERSIVVVLDKYIQLTNGIVVILFEFSV